MRPQGKGVKLALDAHRAMLLPYLYRIHCGPVICITVNHKQWRSVEVKGEFRNQDGAVVIPPACVMLVNPVRQGIGRIDCDAPLYIAGKLVDFILGQVGLMPG